jgi:hypothetical protein
VPHVTKKLALKINTISMACELFYLFNMSWSKTIQNGGWGYFKDYIKIILKQYKMLPHVNTSFVVNVDQINRMLFANENTYMFNQRMKVYFVDFYFPCKDHVVCNYDHMWLVECNY